MNLTNLDQTIKQIECSNKTKCDLNFIDNEFKSEQKYDLQESNIKLKQFQKEQLELNKSNIQINKYDQQIDKNVEENNSQNLESNLQSLYGNDKKNDTNYPDILNNTLFVNIQQVIDIQRFFELEKNQLEQKITEQKVCEEFNLRQKLQEYEQNVNQFNVQRNEFDKKLQEIQQLFKLPNIIDQKDNQQEIIIKLIQENYVLSTKFNNIIYEQNIKQNKLELKIDHLIQQLQQQHIQKENFRIKYLNLKQNCKKNINKIKQSIQELIDIKQSLNYQFNMIHKFNNQILEQLQVFINQRQELEQMKRLNLSYFKLIKQLRSSQNQLIQEKQQFQNSLNIKQIEFQQLQQQSQEIQLQNKIDSEQLKQIIKSQKLEYSNNKQCDLNNIDQINDCEVKSEYADENYGINNNDGFEINYQNTKDQELFSEEPCNDSIENNINQIQQQNIYLEGESYIEEDNTKKDNLLSLKLSDLNNDLQGQSITQKMEFIKKDDLQDDLQDKFKQIDDNDQDIPDIQFDDDLNDVLVQINTNQDIKYEIPLDKNIIDFDQVVQQLKDNNEQSGWDFEGI